MNYLAKNLITFYVLLAYFRDLVQKLFILTRNVLRRMCLLNAIVIRRQIKLIAIDGKLQQQSL